MKSLGLACLKNKIKYKNKLIPKLMNLNSVLINKNITHEHLCISAIN